MSGDLDEVMDVERAGENKESGSAVGYIWSEDYSLLCDQFERTQGRAGLVHGLVHSYGLFESMKIVKPRRADRKQLTQFHSPDYVDFMQKVSSSYCDIDDTELRSEAEEFGLGYDCPLKTNLYEYATLTAGGSLTGTDLLISGLCSLVFHWGGGWHHATADKASGFCYINDCVLAILRLEEHFGRVLYIDLDIHHGDGVQDAFESTARVVTVSFHHHSIGYFPGTGGANDRGTGRGENYSLNIPLDQGAKDDQFITLINEIFPNLFESYSPKAVVLQCGADGLARDPIGVFNLTDKPYCHALTTVLKWNLATLVLGGGGYDAANTARCWTKVTAAALSKTLESDIPEHKFFTSYGPDYSLDLLPGHVKNLNNSHSVSNSIHVVKGIILFEKQKSPRADHQKMDYMAEWCKDTALQYNPF